jgi:hypothetical protein
MGRREFWRTFYGIAEVFLGGSVVTLLSGDYPSQIVQAGVVRKALRGFVDKAVRLGEIMVFNLTLYLEDLGLSIA